MDALSPFIAGLDARQRAILESYLSDDNVPSQVLADRFSVTQERIGQIRREMLANMADFLRKQGISADDLF
jgi:DNA-directed RNA polymerase sigma subunit (sigma70/sigma32)